MESIGTASTQQSRGTKGAQRKNLIRLCNTTRLGSVLENHGFDLFLSHLSSQIGRIFKALSALRGAKIAKHGVAMGSFHLFVHPK